ncbi:hypothetical protein BJAS_P1585 [Bathymodiolus japonicus methanotrophic gill symbiont]|uniref:DUF523 domain-containing protein n=1 Tax=Bathymodiolus japonicus methanotrophic gill symbiont TaxID=113269 RepID=UPI001B7B350C|nr:DUF523 domain-containing protein [Bathymodiolus japonicus methanotrophic gill symbiont]GFO71826.1 hypothetical protein BJAS_P1585 [Bathymodiolus japonicus methanotrophic gill symbiont]
MPQKKAIAISACLLGHKVRYDGNHQENKIILQRLEANFNIIPVCPEVEIGLGVPREKIELHQRGAKIHLLTCKQPVVDLTGQMITYAQAFLQNHKISGMILKDKSPSCGVANCKQWTDTGEMQRNGTGIFAANIIKLKPDLPMLQGNLVTQAGDLDSFLQKVADYEH